MARRLFSIPIPLLLIVFVACLTLRTEGQTAPSGDALPSGSLLEPAELAVLLSKSNRPRPTFIYVGDHPLFVRAHIQGAIFAEPDAKPERIEQLKAVVRNI